MEAFFAALESIGFVEALRFSRWTYAAVNTTHVFAIALLVGGALPLSLRLLGLWPTVTHAHVARILSTTAGAGLVLAVMSGFLLFATRASEYADLAVFQIKLVLVLIGGGSAILTHLRYGWDLGRAPHLALRRAGAVSAIAWSGALILGRSIAFVGD